MPFSSDAVRPGAVAVARAAAGAVLGNPAAVPGHRERTGHARWVRNQHEGRSPVLRGGEGGMHTAMAAAGTLRDVLAGVPSGAIRLEQGTTLIVSLGWESCTPFVVAFGGEIVWQRRKYNSPGPCL